MTNESIEMRNALDRLMEASKSLEALEKSKKLKTDDWPGFLARSQAQLLQLHRKACLRLPETQSFGRILAKRNSRKIREVTLQSRNAQMKKTFRGIFLCYSTHRVKLVQSGSSRAALAGLSGCSKTIF